MPKARKNTTKPRQSNAASLATMRRLCGELTAARVTFVAVSAAFAKIEEIYMRAAPARPDDSRATPADVRAAFETLTVEADAREAVQTFNTRLEQGRAIWARPTVAAALAAKYPWVMAMADHAF